MALANINTIKEAGFTASFTGLIACLAKCKKQNIYPNILWYSSLYTEDISENIFYKYFDLIGFDKPDTIIRTISMGTWEQLEEPRMQWRPILCKTFSDHIRPKGNIIRHIDSIFKGIDLPLIGVHIRNTDRSVEPQWASPGIEYVIKRLIDVIKEYDIPVGLYIASDNIPDVVLLKNTLNKIFPEIKYIEDPNCVRSPDQISVHGNFDAGLNVSKESKALSIITDIFSLARCEKVVRTCSNVTGMVGIISPTTVFIDVSLEFGKQSDEWLQVPGN